MNDNPVLKHRPRLLLALLLLGMSIPVLAQRPQDNWYLDTIWTKDMAATNGGLTTPYGVAIGPDHRIYVGDEGSGRVNVYLPDGTFSFAITNGFGGGQGFSRPRGMITDRDGKLYVADMASNCVFVFTGDGTFLRKIGGDSGTNSGQLRGVIDVAVSRDGEVHVLEYTNARVSIFNQGGAFLRTWSGPGGLDGQLRVPCSIAIAGDGTTFIASVSPSTNTSTAEVKAFNVNGLFLSKVSLGFTSSVPAIAGYGNITFRLGPCSVRADRSGRAHVIVYMPQAAQGLVTNSTYNWSRLDYPPLWAILSGDGKREITYAFNIGTGCSQFDLTLGPPWERQLAWPCHAIGDDGTMILCGTQWKTLRLFRHALREQWAPPRNCIPMPAVLGLQQRPKSPLVDIDYEVADADDTTVHTAMLVFKNDSESLSNCISRLTLVEGTATNLGPSMAANQSHRVTWNAGADWSVNLGDFHVSIVARDSRPGLLDIHYVGLPADRGMPALKISTSPLIPSDFMQAWWWLLATNDVGINLSSNRIYGTTGAYAEKVLCDDGSTTADGRAYLFEKMRVREATAEEVDWAKHGSTGSTVNQWSPVRSVGGRPAAVNEYGFDTGNWDPDTCRWVVPLN